MNVYNLPSKCFLKSDILLHIKFTWSSLLILGLKHQMFYNIYSGSSYIKKSNEH